MRLRVEQEPSSNEMLAFFSPLGFSPECWQVPASLHLSSSICMAIHSLTTHSALFCLTRAS